MSFKFIVVASSTNGTKFFYLLCFIPDKILNDNGYIRVVLLNIPCNLFILFVYVIIGLIIFGVYHDCVPMLNSKNEVNL